MITITENNESVHIMIRRARKSDVPELGRILCQVNNVHAEGRPDLFLKDHRKYSDEELTDLLGDPGRPVFVLTEDDRKIKGYAFCMIEQYGEGGNMVPRRTVYIDDICVDEICRGQHVGRQLYQYVCEYARSIGAYNITLNVWSCNPTAAAFYEAMGMTPYKVGMEYVLGQEDSRKNEEEKQ